MNKSPSDFYSEVGVQWLSEKKSVETSRKEFEYLIRLLRKEGKILDLACGYGRFAIPLASMGYQVSGIDITPTFIERAKDEASKRKVSIEFTVGDMTNLPYRDNSFDSIICMWNAFSELPAESDQLKALLEAYRVLRSGGNAFIEVRNHRSPGLVNNNSIDGVPAMPSFNHTRGSLRRLMKLSQIKDFKVFIDDFGGRKRLILQLMKG